MRGSVLDWLVGKWQWPSATLFAAGFLVVLAPVVFFVAGVPLGLVFLQLPMYMAHQYEEHRGDRFRRWINDHLGHGCEVLTPMATFGINSLLVWLPDLVALYLACFVDLSFGLVAIYLPLFNAVTHIAVAIATRSYNPGLWTSVGLFLPVGLVSLVVVSRAAGSTPQAQQLALATAIAVHAVIIVSVRRRMARGLLASGG